MMCITVLLFTVLPFVSNAGICIKGSVIQKSLNGYYSDNGQLNNKPRYSKSAGQCGNGASSIYYKSGSSNYYITDDKYINTNTYQLKCPDDNIATPDLCPPGTFIAGTGSGPVTEASVTATNTNSADDCGVKALSQCGVVQISGSDSFRCNTYFTKVRDNLFFNGAETDADKRYIYYNTNDNIYGFQTFICSAADPEDTCSSSAYTGTRSEQISLETYNGGSLSIPIDGGGSYTLDCNPPTPAPTTPSPTAALVAGGLCVGMLPHYIDSNGVRGQYVADGTYNGQPRYKSQCNNRFIVYYNDNYKYLIANGADSSGISRFYNQCTNNIGDLTQCSWSNAVTVSDSYNECNCPGQAGVAEPISFDTMPVHDINNNDGDDIFWNGVSEVILTSVFVTMCVLSIVLCAYCIGFKHGANKIGYTKAYIEEV